MIIRVKLVSNMSSDGATASSVRPMIMVMLSLGLPRLPPRFTDTVPPEEVPLLVLAGEAGVCGLCGDIRAHRATRRRSMRPCPLPRRQVGDGGPGRGDGGQGLAVALPDQARLATASTAPTATTPPTRSGKSLFIFCMALRLPGFDRGARELPT